MEIDSKRRFNGVAKVYGNSAYKHFTTSHITIIGLGGVGSWVCEALARSAVGKLTLIDMDHVAESNINRQLQANTNSLGQAKGLAIQQRIQTINPNCHTHWIDDFITVENQHEYIPTHTDWVIDCIDDYRMKASLIAHCQRYKIKVITVGGAGGMTDPSKILIDDLSRTVHDPLLSKTRKQLRQCYHFTNNPKRRFSIPAVYSMENLKYPAEDGEVSQYKPKNGLGGLSCASGFGSSVVVTASMGFASAAYVLNKIAKK